MAAPTFSTEVSAAGRYPNSRFNARERKLLESVDTHLASGTDTFANKTLTSPTINGTITSSAADTVWTLEANDATALKIGSAASQTMLVFDTRTAGTGAQLTANVELHVADTTDSSSITTGSAIIDGGAGVAKKLYVGTDAHVAGVVYADGTTASSSKDTGALICDGGVGIEKELYVGLNANIAGQLVAAASTASSSKDTGALLCEGGAGIEKELYVGLSANVAGQLNADAATASTSVSTGAFVCDGGAGIAGAAYIGSTVNVAGQLNADATTQSTSPSTGAAVIDGGLGVAKDAFFGGDVTVREQLVLRGLNDEFQARPFVANCVLGASFTTPAVADNAVNVLATVKEIYSVTNITEQTVALLTWSTSGINIAGDLAGADGFEVNPGYDITSANPYAMTVGTDNFYIDGEIAVQDITKQDEVMIGWRKAEAHQDTYSSYADAAAMNIDKEGDVILINVQATTDASADSVGDDIANGQFARFKVAVDDVQGLAAAIALATEIRTDYNAHLADAGEHTTAVDAVNTTAAAVPTDLASLITYVTEALTDYDAHESDSELGAAWLYHAAQEAGDVTLASTAAPTDLATCITRLNDLRTKFNSHDADGTAHGTDTQHQITTVKAARVFYTLGKNTSTLSAVTVPLAANLDDGEVMIPFVRQKKIAAGGAGTVNLRNLKIGKTA